MHCFDNNVKLYILLIIFGKYYFLSDSLQAQDEVALHTATVGSDTFLASGYQISKRTNSEWKLTVNFPFPTVSLLLQYRPHVTSHFGFNEERESFVDVVQEVSSTINTVCEADGKLWVGFGFYEGEGSEGYGGIGFYDPTTSRAGVLRHPALIDCSVKSLLITDSVFYVQTVGYYELSTTVGNGLVIIDRESLLAKAMIPPGTSTLWDKDDPMSADSFYNRAIPEILKDTRFLQKDVPQFSHDVIRSFQEIGLDSFMVSSLDAEKAIRQRAVSNAKLKIQDILTMPTQDGRWSQRGGQTGVEVYAGTYTLLDSWGGTRIVQLQCPVNGVAHFSIETSYGYPARATFFIKPSSAYPGLIDDDKRYIVAETGQIFIAEEFPLLLRITFDKLEAKTASCLIDGKPTDFQYFSSALVRVEVWELQE